jgi:pseudouridine synthase
MRIQKIISMMGITSRRKAEKLLLEGRISVNGQAVTSPGFKADPVKDHIRIDGKLLKKTPKPAYYLLNKPPGCLCSLSDPENRPLVTDFLKGVRERVYPAGRLDFNTEGLLVLTNDGALARFLQHPSSQCPKTYELKVSGQPPGGTLERLEAGIVMDGKRTLPCKIRVLRNNQASTILSVTLREGRKHQIKKMFNAIGCPVKNLKRVAIGPLRIDRPRLKKGECRRLTDREINQITGMMRGS